MEYSQTIKSQQHQNFANVLKNEKFTDATFIIGTQKTKFNVNRLFLSSISTEFDKLLHDDEKSNIFTISNIDPDGFECVVNYAYANNPNFNDKNVLSALYICQKYDIPSLFNLCEAYFTKNICANNVCILLNEAVRLNLASYVKTCKKYVTDHPSEVLHITQTEGFLQLSLSAMKLILQMNELAIEENHLWSKVVTWADYQSKTNDYDELKHDSISTKTEILKQVGHLIRFGLMDIAYFTQHVATENVLTKEELLNVFMYNSVKTLGCNFNLTKRVKVDKYLSAAECKHGSYDVYNDESKNEQRCTINTQLFKEDTCDVKSNLCDTKFVIGKNKSWFVINRLFLASISPVFEAMLYGNMKESELNAIITVPDIDSDAFKCVLNYAYCGNPSITDKEVLDVYHICDKYQIEFLKKECYKYFKQCITTHNICYLLDTAVALKIDSAITKIINLLNTSKKMKQIFNSEGFCEMKLRSMRLFLDCTLPFAEEVIWDRILKWASHQSSQPISSDDNKYDETQEELKVNEIDIKKEKCLLISVRDLIRFGLMDGKYFANKVALLNVLKQMELIEVLLYFQDPTFGVQSFKMERRIPKPKSRTEELNDEHDKKIAALKDEVCALKDELKTYAFKCVHTEIAPVKIEKSRSNGGNFAGFIAYFNRPKIFHQIEIGNKKNEVKLSPFCICGNTTVKVQAVQCNDNSVKCNGCGKQCVSGNMVWHCNKNKIRKHRQGYDLCMSCATRNAALTLEVKDLSGKWTDFLHFNILQKGEIKKFNISAIGVAIGVYSCRDKRAATNIDLVKIYGHDIDEKKLSKRCEQFNIFVQTGFC